MDQPGLTGRSARSGEWGGNCNFPIQPGYPGRMDLPGFPGGLLTSVSGNNGISPPNQDILGGWTCLGFQEVRSLRRVGMTVFPTQPGYPGRVDLPGFPGGPLTSVSGNDGFPHPTRIPWKGGPTWTHRDVCSLRQVGQQLPFLHPTRIPWEDGPTWVSGGSARFGE